MDHYSCGISYIPFFASGLDVLKDALSQFQNNKGTCLHFQKVKHNMHVRMQAFAHAR
jgi:hypothetical protein